MEKNIKKDVYICITESLCCTSSCGSHHSKKELYRIIMSPMDSDFQDRFLLDEEQRRKWIYKGTVLYSTGNSAQYSVITEMGKELEKE